MKNYDEITNDLLKRRDQYETEQRNKRKVGCWFAIITLNYKFQFIKQYNKPRQT